MNKNTSPIERFQKAKAVSNTPEQAFCYQKQMVYDELTETQITIDEKSLKNTAETIEKTIRKAFKGGKQ